MFAYCGQNLRKLKFKNMGIDKLGPSSEEAEQFSFAETQSASDQTREEEKPLIISQLDSEDAAGIAAYYQFEVAHGFSELNEKKTLAGMTAFRQRQIRENKLQVAVAKEGDKLAATSVIVLENGTMGKEIQDNEAWAAGTVVLSGKRGLGIGEQMSAAQDRIAKSAGKESILTTITNDNYPSMRLRLKVGYVLEGVGQREDEVSYKYRKDLVNEAGVSRNWKEEMALGRLEAVTDITESSAEQILIDPNNADQVKQALDKGYKGVYLLSPRDFGEPKPIDKNLIVFTRRMVQSSESAAR